MRECRLDTPSLLTYTTMRNSLVAAATLLILLFSSAEINASGCKYITNYTAEGMLFHIQPQKMPKANSSTAKKSLSYDITCVTENDSVAFVSSIWTASPYIADSVQIIISPSTTITLPIEFIYTERKGSAYISRVRFYVMWEDLKMMYASPTPFVLDYGKGITYSFPKNKWPKQSKDVNDVINLIELNRHRNETSD